jgi:hypothetical protein
MYQDLRRNFWWTRMKREIARYVSECDTCRRIKADHLRPAGNLQPLSIPEWKWENICMDFIVGLPCTSRGYNSRWVIVDRLTVPRPTRQLPLSPLCPASTRARRTSPASAALGSLPGVVHRSGPGPMAPPPHARDPHFSLPFPLCSAAIEPLAPRLRCSTRSPVPTPLRPLLSSARASPPLPAPGPPPLATGSPLSLTDSGRAPPSSATPR